MHKLESLWKGEDPNIPGASQKCGVASCNVSTISAIWHELGDNTHRSRARMTRLVRKTQGMTGLRVASARVTRRSQASNAIQRRPESMRSMIAYAERHGKPESASWKLTVSVSAASNNNRPPRKSIQLRTSFMNNVLKVRATQVDNL